MSKPKWSYTAGQRPWTVKVYERGPAIYMAWWDAATGRYVRRSLKHNDRDRAVGEAHDLAEKRRHGHAPTPAEALTVGQMLERYVAEKRPTRKGKRQCYEDDRRRRMWVAVLGPNLRVDELDIARIEALAVGRSRGTLGADGRPTNGSAKPVGNATILKDIRWLYASCERATRWTRSGGGYALDRNPMRRFMPELVRRWREPTPMRPIATDKWFEAVVTAARRMQNGAYVQNLLTIVRGTGRRVSAVLHLRASDYVAPTSDAPYGSLRWRREHDKQRYDAVVPVNTDVAAAIEAQRSLVGAVGRGWLFAKPDDPSEPWPYRRARRWLLRAEQIAGVDHQPQLGYHALRRCGVGFLSE